MRTHASRLRIIRVLETTLFAIVLFDVLVWGSLFASGGLKRAPAVVTGAGTAEPVPEAVEPPSVAPEVADGEAASPVAEPAHASPDAGPPAAATAAPGGDRRAADTRKGPAAAAAAGGSEGHRGIGVPVRIRIPRIALDAAVEKVTLAADGSMGVPKRPLDAAWYALGPRPGEEGSATIAGHLDWFDGATAVFADLHEVKSGDVVTVQDDKGSTITFVVRETRHYDAAADASDVFVSNDGRAHLNIVTCDGSWDRGAEQYTKRLVVFTDKVNE